MKLATYDDGSRDGHLLVVSRDLGSGHYATGIATRLQQVLDDWNFLAPQLEDLARMLDNGHARHAFAFEPQRCMAPLPRSYQRVVAGGGHRLRRCTSTGLMPASHGLALPADSADDATLGWSAQVAVITGDVARGPAAEVALEAVRLIVLVNEIGPPDASVAAAFAPLAVTPDELGPAWQSGRVRLPLRWRQREQVLEVDAGAAMERHFGTLIAQLAEDRGVGAGSIVGSGSLGADGVLRRGDALRIELLDGHGQSVFGAIDQALRVS